MSRVQLALNVNDIECCGGPQATGQEEATSPGACCK
jgi:hypothetical protein